MKTHNGGWGRWLIAGLAAMALAGIGLGASAGAATPPANLCDPGSTVAAGSCTLYTPNGTYNAGGSVAYSYNASTQVLTLVFSGFSASAIQDGPWICVGPSPMQSYLNSPANVCTPNGVLAKSPNQRILPSTSSGLTFTFNGVPNGDFWFIHIVVNGNTLEAGSPSFNTGNLDVTKTADDQAHTPLAGAGFTLYVDNGGSQGAQVGTCTTDSSGTCSMIDLAPGTYILVETTAPNGYTGGTPKTVTVTAGQTTNASFVDTAVEIPPGTNSITVKKQDDTGTALVGAGFALYTDAGGAPGTPVGISCTVATVSNNVASCEMADVPDGNYWVVETTTPSGYSGSAPQQVTVNDGNSEVTLTFTDTPIPITPPVGPGGGTTTTTTTTAPATVTGATTVHTGEPWSGSGWLVVAVAGLGAALGAGGVLRRRQLRRHTA